MPQKLKNISIKTFHFFKWLFVGLLVVFIALVLFIRSSWGQNIIKNKVTDFVAQKIDAQFSIDKLYLGFSGDLIIEELYLEDQQKDTLLYSKELEISVALLPIVTQNTIRVKSVNWTGLVAKVLKPEKTHQYNFDYIINAFVNPNTSEEPEIDTDSKPFVIKVENVRFSDFDLLFKDEVMGIDTHLVMGSLGVDFGKEFNLNTLRFPIENVALANVDVKYIQTKEFPVTPKSEESSTLPWLEIENLSFKNIKAFYQDQVAQSLAEVDLGDFTLENAWVDLDNQNININAVGLQNTTAELAFINNKKSTVKDTIQVVEKTSFEWPNWKVKLKELAFTDNTIALKTGNEITSKKIFNPQDFQLNNTRVLIQDFELDQEKVAVNVKEISFVEKSGFQLKDFELKGFANHKKIELEQLNIQTNLSGLNTKGNIAYNNINTLIDEPKKILFNIAVKDLDLNIKDAYYFSPTLYKNEYVQKFSKHSVTGNLTAKGSLKEIVVPSLNLNWGENTNVKLSVNINDVLTENNMSFVLPNFRFKTDNSSLNNWVNEQELGLVFPTDILLTSNTKGNVKELTTNTLLETSDGSLRVNGKVFNKEIKGFDGLLKVSELALGKLIKNEQLGLLDFDIKLKIEASNLASLKAKVNTTFNSLEFNGYDYKPLKLEADIYNGSGEIKTTFKDDYLDFDTNTHIELDSVVSKVRTAIQVKGVDLKGLQLTDKDLKARINVNADFSGTAETFTLSSKTDNGLVVYNKETVPVSPVFINASASKDSTNVKVDSGFLNLNLNGNAKPAQIITAISKHITSYFKPNKTSTDTLVKNTQLKAELKIKQAPILEKVFLEGVSDFDPITFELNFNETAHQMVSTFQVPFLEYEESSINNASFSLNTQNNDFTLDFKVDNVKHNPVDIEQINLQGKVINQVVHLDFFTTDGTEKIININSEITKQDTLVKVHLNPENIILNRKKWEIPSTNQILFGQNNITSSDFKLFRNKEQIEFNAKVNEKSDNVLEVDFKDFNLLNVFSFLNPQEELVSGLANGNINVSQFNKGDSIGTNMVIENLKVLNNTLGELGVEASTANNKNYNLHLTLQEKEMIDLVVDGSYQATNTENPLNLKVDLHKLGLNKLEEFGKEFISNASGSISANFNMNGTFNNPIYNGDLNFNNAQLKVTSFNTDFTFPEENIKVDNSSVLLNKFTVLDTDGNSFVLDGKILTKDLMNPVFDLSVKTKNLQILNSTKEDNDLYYGKLFFDADVKIGGDLNIPKVTGALKVGKNSNLTYIVPNATIDAVEREGVVLFVNKKVTNDILTSETRTDKNTEVLKGMDIEMVLKVDKSAVLNVIIDKKTGDNLQVQGEADLVFGLTPNGMMNLSGKYEVNSGHYEASLYNLVNRKFEIDKGSKITWHGDLLEADMDIRAIYKINTSASGLMSSVTSGMDAETISQYRKKMPFWVYLNLNGELLTPEISFDLDIPEDSRGELSGQVYTQVQQLNTSEEDLNKQVFSLLVLNQFFPSNTSDGSSGGSLSIARDNVNKALSNQLNNFSNKLTGNTGIELGFELDSYTDYSDGTEENNTELNVSAKKRLFNDRLTVQVGSGFEVENQSKDDDSPIIGNVNIEYALTEDRRYRLKGFHKNEFESVIDGQVIVTGISLLFNREFNKFRELWLKEHSKSKRDEK